MTERTNARLFGSLFGPPHSALSLCLIALCFATPAAAQDPAPEAAAEAAAETPAPPAEASAEEATATEPEEDEATDAERALEKDLDLFWGERRKVEVVQKRLYEKDGRFELTAVGATVPNDDFIVYYPVGVRVGYHFSEAFAVEGSYAFAIDDPNDLTNFLEDEIGLKRAQLQETIQQYYNVGLLWAPIYGKISLLGMKLTHFDTYIGMAAGIFHTTEFPATNPDGNKVVKVSGNATLGFRWFITNTFNVRTEYRHFFFEKFQGGISQPIELSLGLGVML